MSLQNMKISWMLGQNETVLTFTNGATVAAIAIGTCRVLLPSEHVIVLSNCLYYERSARNIISVSRLIKENYEFSFINDMCSILHNRKVIGSTKLTNGLFTIDVSGNVISVQISSMTLMPLRNAEAWS